MTFDWGILVSVLGGGALGGLGTWVVGLKKQRTDTFEVLITKYAELYAGQETRIASMEAKISTLVKENENLEREVTNSRIEINNLRNQLILFEGSNFDLPLPMWYKDKEGRMVHLNKHYEETFLEPLGIKGVDYLGKMDNDIWGKGNVDFAKNDKKVLRTRKHIRVIEEVPDGSGNTFKIEVLKYPRFLNNQLIGVGGIVLRNID